MNTTYRAQFFVNASMAVTDTESVMGARQLVEAAGEGTVTRFRPEVNMPYCLPEITLRATGLWVYEKGQWSAVSLGRGERFPGAPY